MMTTQTLDRLLKFALHEAKNEGEIFQSDDYAELDALINSAPDLLEALRSARYWLFSELKRLYVCDQDASDHQAIKEIDAAIAKAEGK